MILCPQTNLFESGFGKFHFAMSVDNICWAKCVTKLVHPHTVWRCSYSHTNEAVFHNVSSISVTRWLSLLLCNDVWRFHLIPVNVGLHYPVGGFSCPSPACFILKHSILYCVFSWCSPIYQSVVSFLSHFEPMFARCRFNSVCSFPYLMIEVSHHYRVVIWFP